MKFEVAIDAGVGNDEHGDMIVLIRFRSYILLNGSPLVITFSLGEDVSLHAVLGLPIMLLCHMPLDFTTGTLHCPTINVEFILYMHQLGVSMPAGEQFDKYTFTVTPTKTTLCYIRLLHTATVPMPTPQLIPTTS